LSFFFRRSNSTSRCLGLHVAWIGT
jgi:hypothetical protein